ncbi:hypothetical protein ACOSP7_012373 [Xanthoceras sorbifolium]|uniref:Uncharacterized protein n=1 Tax=Xanthoceras sorbifolium TaxID=99658 RepID=A0ABQ8HXV5_9ROSI|nr:hypothetical protein JRO89_XS06G0112300 [Xanthoceras sorbifolium]
MAASATEMVVRLVLDGSLSLTDMEVERRPYHRNCSCALHNLKLGASSSAAACCSKQNKLLFPKKKSWTAGCSLLSSMASPTSIKMLSSHAKNSLLSDPTFQLEA